MKCHLCVIQMYSGVMVSGYLSCGEGGGGGRCGGLISLYLVKYWTCVPQVHLLLFRPQTFYALSIFAIPNNAPLSNMVQTFLNFSFLYLVTRKLIQSVDGSGIG